MREREREREFVCVCVCVFRRFCCNLFAEPTGIVVSVRESVRLIKGLDANPYHLPVERGGAFQSTLRPSSFI